MQTQRTHCIRNYFKRKCGLCFVLFFKSALMHIFFVYLILSSRAVSVTFCRTWKESFRTEIKNSPSPDDDPTWEPLSPTKTEKFDFRNTVSTLWPAEHIPRSRLSTWTLNIKWGWSWKLISNESNLYPILPYRKFIANLAASTGYPAISEIIFLGPTLITQKIDYNFNIVRHGL